MRDAVIVEAVRTPVGKRNGGLSGIHSADLSAHVLEALVARAGIDPVLIDDVIWGCVMRLKIAGSAVRLRPWPPPSRGPSHWGGLPPYRAQTGDAARRSCGCGPKNTLVATSSAPAR